MKRGRTIGLALVCAGVCAGILFRFAVPAVGGSPYVTGRWLEHVDAKDVVRIRVVGSVVSNAGESRGVPLGGSYATITDPREIEELLDAFRMTKRAYGGSERILFDLRSGDTVVLSFKVDNYEVISKHTASTLNAVLERHAPWPR